MNKFMITIGLIFLFGGFAFAQQTASDESVVYKKTPQGDLSLEIFYPENHSDKQHRPAIVFFFGGGWAVGNPSQFYEQCKYFASRGIVAISADYRIYKKHKTSPFECVKDGKSAIRWVREHAGELGIDPDRVAASGGSAGGHVAASTALIENMDEEGEDREISSVPNALVLFNPVLDTTEKGYGSKKVKGRETEISPCHHIKNNLPPTIIFHGTGDTTVPFENAMRFTQLMQQAGNVCQLYPAEGKNHGFFNPSIFKKTNTDDYFNMSMYESDVFLNQLGYTSGAPTIQPFQGLKTDIGDYACYTPIAPVSFDDEQVAAEVEVSVLTSAKLLDKNPMVWRKNRSLNINKEDSVLLSNGYAIAYVNSKKVEQNEIISTDYHELRSGLKNSMIKFTRNKKGRVAFLGGSITFNNGWRDSICAYLQKRFPDTEFEFIAAGIPSMGSTPGAFRLERDVLSKEPIDLLFEEAAVNDAANGIKTEDHIRGMEGIIRHARNVNPSMDIVMMHFVDPSKMESYRQGKVPLVIQNHDKVAEHYRISTVNLAKEVTDRIDAGEFTWEDDFKNLHPSPFGQGVYARSLIAFLETAWKGYVADDDKVTAYEQPEMLDKDCYCNGVLLTASDNVKLTKGWYVDENWKPTDHKRTRPNYVNVPMLIGEGANGWLKFEFEGTAVGIAVAAGPDAGIIEYRIDGEKSKIYDLFTKWSTQLHLPKYNTLISGLKKGKHTLKIRIAEEKNPQSVGNVCRIRYFYVNK
jgi:acetyl esterase/lipase/lysophospholipase L1-like esterase